VILTLLGLENIDTGNAIQRIRTILDKPKGPTWVWDVDIEKCFDKISHEFLEKETELILCPKAYEMNYHKVVKSSNHR
jgi:retron-type reverse transcriptase